VLAGGSGLVDVETIIPDGAGGGTMIARAPRSRAVTPKPAPPAVAAVQAHAPAPARAPAAEEPDPIVAIAAAARDIDPVAPENAPAPRETPPDPTGIYLQLGAFGSRENAESYLTRARVQFDWLGERLQVRVREGLYRVHAGPYAREAEARQAAERIALSLGIKPVVTR